MNNPDNINNQFNPESGRYIHNSQIKQNKSNHISQSTHNHIINPWVLKICIFVLSALGILAMFLPFVSVDIFTYSESLYLFKTGDSFGDGVIYVVLLLIVIVLTTFNKRLISLITSILTALGFSITLNNLYTKAGDYSEMLNPQAGFLLACLSIYGLVIVTLIQTVFSHLEKKASIEVANKTALMNSNPSGEVDMPENKLNQNLNNSDLNAQM